MNFLSRFRGVAAAVVAVTVMAVGSTMAHAQVTLPDTGIDIPGHVTAGITAMGLIAGAALGGYMAFLLIRRGMRWLKSAF